MAENENKQIDLEEEIASLDEFLKEESADEVDAFPLDDESFASFDEEQPVKKSKGRFLGTVALIALLGGSVYAGMQYLPKLMSDPTLSDFEQAMQSRVDNFSDNLVPSPVHPPQDDPINEPLPMAADMAMNDTTPVPVSPVEKDLAISNVDITIVQEGEVLPDDIITLNDQNNAGNAFGGEFTEAMPSAPVEEFVADVETQTATSIAEIVEIAEEATEQATVQIESNEITPVVVDEIANMAEGPITEDLPEIAEKNSSPELPTSFERVEAQPLKKAVMAEALEKADIDPVASMASAMEEDVVPAINDDNTVVGAATEDAMIENVQGNALDTAPTVPELETIAGAELTKEAGESAAEAIVTVQEPRAPTVETIVNPEPIPEEATPVVEMMKEEPVIQASTKETKVVKTSPKKVAVKKKAPKRQDPRVMEARRAYEQGDYQTALALYESVLQSDRGNTAALTGRQLAKAKARTIQPQSATPQSVDPNALTSTALQDRVVRDASVALTKAQQYHKAGQKAQAIEWYRKALQLDVIYKGGIDRAGVYDALADLQ